MEEAILHALFEDIERDAWSICEYRDATRGDIVVEDDGSLPAQLISKFADQGIEIHLKDLTSDIGIPTIGAAADDVRTKDPEMLTIGVGTHLNPEIAAVRAITEVAQSRATHKHGAKINAQLQKVTQDMGYERIKQVNRMWFGRSPRTVSSPDSRSAQWTPRGKVEGSGACGPRAKRFVQIHMRFLTTGSRVRNMMKSPAMIFTTFISMYKLGLLMPRVRL